MPLAQEYQEEKLFAAIENTDIPHQVAFGLSVPLPSEPSRSLPVDSFTDRTTRPKNYRIARHPNCAERNLFDPAQTREVASFDSLVQDRIVQATQGTTPTALEPPLFKLNMRNRFATRGRDYSAWNPDSMAVAGSSKLAQGKVVLHNQSCRKGS
jgi:hypothetical protein